MTIWGLNKLPQWKNEQKTINGIVATNNGFEDAVTGEVLVAVGMLSNKEGASKIATVEFDKASYVRGGTVLVAVTFVERVISGVATTLTLTWSGVSGNVTANAAAYAVAAGKNVYVYTAVVPSEAGTLSVGTQTIAGGIFDALDARPLSNTAITSAVALAAGTRVVA